MCNIAEVSFALALCCASCKQALESLVYDPKSVSDFSLGHPIMYILTKQLTTTQPWNALASKNVTAEYQQRRHTKKHHKGFLSRLLDVFCSGTLSNPLEKGALAAIGYFGNSTAQDDEESG